MTIKDDLSLINSKTKTNESGEVYYEVKVAERPEFIKSLKSCFEKNWESYEHRIKTV